MLFSVVYLSSSYKMLKLTRKGLCSPSHLNRAGSKGFYKLGPPADNPAKATQEPTIIKKRLASWPKDTKTGLGHSTGRSGGCRQSPQQGREKLPDRRRMHKKGVRLWAAGRVKAASWDSESRCKGHGSVTGVQTQHFRLLQNCGMKEIRNKTELNHQGL